MNIRKLLSQLGAPIETMQCQCGRLHDAVERKLIEAKKDESFTLAENIRLERQIEASVEANNVLAGVANLTDEGYCAAMEAARENGYPESAEAFEATMKLARWLRAKSEAINAEVASKKKAIHESYGDSH